MQIQLDAYPTALGELDATSVLVALDDGRIGVAREGGFEELGKIRGDVEQLVSVAGSVHAVTATRTRTELWRITPRMERLGAIDPPAIAVAGGEIVFVRQDQIFVGERALIALPRAERIRVSTARKLACTGEHVVYDPVGAPSRVCAVPLAGGALEVWLEGDDFRIAAGPRELVVVTRQNLERRPLPAREPVTRTPLAAGEIMSLQLAGDVVAWHRRDKVIEASFAGSAPQRIGRGRCMQASEHGVWLADGKSVTFIEKRIAATVSARARDVIDAIRAAGGAYEKTTVGGKPAIAIAKDGGRALKIVTESELAEIESALG